MSIQTASRVTHAIYMRHFDERSFMRDLDEHAYMRDFDEHSFMRDFDEHTHGLGTESSIKIRECGSRATRCGLRVTILRS